MKNSSKSTPAQSVCWIWQVPCVLHWTRCEHAETAQQTVRFEPPVQVSSQLSMIRLPGLQIICAEGPRTD